MGLNNLSLYQQLVPSSSAASAASAASPASAGTGDDDHVKANGVPVYLNVYDLTTLNMYAYWFGLGIFHSGIEVHGVEYAFGAHEYPTSGVFEVEPHKCPGFIFRRSIQLGTTDMGPLQLREFMESAAADYNGDTYHLLLKNCNHFCEDISIRLINQPIPGWVNRLARVGWVCRCFLPECLQVTAAQHLSELEYSEESAEGKEIVGKDTVEDEQEQEQEQEQDILLQERVLGT